MRYPLFIALFVSLFAAPLHAQYSEEQIQLTGLVVTGEQQYGVPGVHVYIPKAGKGVITNELGYFSISTLPLDSVVISAVGYKHKHFKVPLQDDDGSVSIIVNLKEDTTTLPQVTIYPYPTEELFKEAFLALRLPETEHENMRRNMEENMLRYMAFNYEGDESLNHSYFMDRQFNQWQRQTSYPRNPTAQPLRLGQIHKKCERW